MSAVVRSEVDEGVVLLPQPAERVQQLTHPPVQLLYRLVYSPRVFYQYITSCPPVHSMHTEMFNIVFYGI